MKTKAAVLYKTNNPMVVESLDLEEPKEGEVLVRLVAAGVCYSDYHLITGEWTHPLPAVFGHEGAGVVQAVGPGVTKIKEGQHVVLNFRANCGGCKYCIVGRPVLCNGIEAPRHTMFDGTSRLHKDGQIIHTFARTACFSEYVVVPETGAVPIRSDMPLDKACLVGCAVSTGVGSVINTAKVVAGATVVVIGCGGVGLNVIQGAALVGAGRIIAVDVLDNKLDHARQFGATHFINSKEMNAIENVLELTNGGADYVFEVIGRSNTIESGYQMLGLGGTLIIVGMTDEKSTITINSLSVPRNERVIIGSWYGSTRPWVDLPKITDLYMDGKLKIDPLISRRYSLDDINEAFDALIAGEVARSIIIF